MLTIREAYDQDFAGIWPIYHAVVSKGDSYAFPLDSDQDYARQVWMKAPKASYVAIDAGEIVGTYFIKANQAGPGSHVCNAGFMVKANTRGKGIGRSMGEHSLIEAKKLGFKAMQFNMVVSSNEIAVKLWENLGFSIVGTLKQAYEHKQLGFVDAYVMYKLL